MNAVRKATYVNRRPGAGKTYAMARVSIREAEAGRNVLIVQPSRKLIQGTLEEIKSGGYAGLLETISRDTSDAPARSLVEAISQNSLDETRIVLTTHQALLHAGLIGRAEEWRVFIDEEPPVATFFSSSVPRTHQLLTDLLSSVVFDDEESILWARNREAIRQLSLSGSTDELLAKFRSLAARLISPIHDTFVNTVQYDGLLSGAASDGRLNAISILRPDVFTQFASPVFLCASFEDTLFHHLMKDRIEFREDVQLNHFISADRDAYSGVTVYYYLRDSKWSKRFRKNNSSVDQMVETAIRREVGSDQLAYQNNVGHNSFDDGLGVWKVDNSPYGINNLMHVDHIAVMSSVIPSGPHRSFLMHRGLTEEQIHVAFTVLPTYQALYRCSLRDRSRSGPNKLFVGEAKTAYWIADQFPGCAVRQLEVGLDTSIDPVRKPVGRPRLHSSPAARQAAYMARKSINGKTHTQSSLCTQSSNIVILNDDIHYSNIGFITYSIYPDLGALRPISQGTCETVSSFYDLLEEMHGRVLLAREENFLMSTASFEDMPGVPTTRGKANIVSISGLWLDNDGGTAPYGEWAGLLSMIEMVCFNTFKHTQDQPRYRVFIPTQRAMSAAEYQAVVGQLLLAATDAFGPNHGFDTSKAPASSLFYAPCQAAGNEDGFFTRFVGDVRRPLAPDDWMPEVEESDEVQNLGADPDSNGEVEVPVDDLIERHRAGTASPGNGNAAFKDLALGLRGRRLPYDAIRGTLHSEAAHARNPAQRRAQIEPLIAWMKTNLS